MVVPTMRHSAIARLHAGASEFFSKRASKLDTLGAGGALGAASCRENFALLSRLLAIGQVTAVAPIGFATLLLDATVGCIGTSLLALAYATSYLLLGPRVVFDLGVMESFAGAASCGVAYALLFAVATLLPAGGVAQWITYCLGAVLAGLGIGVLWHAQEEFLTESGAFIAVQDLVPLRQTRISLRAHLTSRLVALEVALPLCISLAQCAPAQRLLPGPLRGASVVFFFLAALAGLAAAGMGRLVARPPSARSIMAPKAAPCMMETFRAARSLWRVPTTWRLSFLSLSFGMSGGYMAGLVNGAFAKGSAALGASSVGTLVAVSSLAAALGSRYFSGLPQTKKGAGAGMNTNRVVVTICSACFASVPALVLLFRPSPANNYLGVWLAALYVLYGCGRGAYQCTEQAIVADFFPGPSKAGALANSSMLRCAGFFVACALQCEWAPWHRQVLALASLILALAVMPCYASARRIRRGTTPVMAFEDV